MKTQKLKAFEDFLRRAEIIPETLLMISKNTPSCQKAINEFGKLDYEIPFYELNLSEHPDLESVVLKFCDQNKLPALVYFRGTHMINKQDEVERALDLTKFIRKSKTLVS